MNKSNKPRHDKLRFAPTMVRVLSRRDLRAAAGGRGGCCGAGSELKDIYTGIPRRCCDLNSELMAPGSAG